jgi:Cu-Zn family superoxide dismutase
MKTRWFAFVRAVGGGLMVGAVMLTAASGALAQQTTLPTPGPGSEQPNADASAVVRDASGHTLATAEFRQQSRTEIVMRLLIADPPRLTGSHAVQIHAVGQCYPPDFTTSGALFNPTKKPHGLSSDGGPAVGDLPNLNYTTGLSTYTAAIHGGVFSPGSLNSLSGGSGTSLVIFQNPDDGVTQPEGNAGARIGCGVITTTPPVAARALVTPLVQVTSVSATATLVRPTPLATATAVVRPTVRPTASPTTVAAAVVRPAIAQPAVVQQQPAVVQQAPVAVQQQPAPAQQAVAQNLAALAVPTATLAPLVAAPLNPVPTTVAATSTSSGPPPIFFVLGGLVAIGIGYGLGGLRRRRSGP